jgi:hypothetical protein
MAFLYGMTLLGTWTTLVPNKLVEARKLDGTNRRLIALAAGLLMGGVGLVLARTLRLDLSAQHDYFDNPRYLGPVYFGVLYTVMGGWSSLVARDRTARPLHLPARRRARAAARWPRTRRVGCS